MLTRNANDVNWFTEATGINGFLHDCECWMNSHHVSNHDSDVVCSCVLLQLVNSINTRTERFLNQQMSFTSSDFDRHGDMQMGWRANDSSIEIGSHRFVEILERRSNTVSIRDLLPQVVINLTDCDVGTPRLPKATNVAFTNRTNTNN